MKCFVIHLEGSDKRAVNVDRLRETLADVVLFPAVRGADLSADQRQSFYRPNLHRPRYPFPLGASEIGCFLSHRGCWQKIVDDDLPGALIAEDDLGLGAGWSDALDVLKVEANPERFIRLPAKDRESRGKPDQAKVFLPRVIGLQMVLQYVGREAARRLLAASVVCDRPVDTFLQMHWVHGQPIHTILPNGVSELAAQLGGSTIQKKQGATGLLGREWNRFVYRRRVATRPQT